MPRSDPVFGMPSCIALSPDDLYSIDPATGSFYMFISKVFNCFGMPEHCFKAMRYILTILKAGLLLVWLVKRSFYYPDWVTVRFLPVSGLFLLIANKPVSHKANCFIVFSGNSSLKYERLCVFSSAKREKSELNKMNIVLCFALCPADKSRHA